MTQFEFTKRILEALEIDDAGDVSQATVLMDLPGYDSMARLSLIALADELFSVKLSMAQLGADATVGTLIDVIGREHFE